MEEARPQLQVWRLAGDLPLPSQECRHGLHPELECGQREPRVKAGGFAPLDAVVHHGLFFQQEAVAWR